MEVDSQRRVCVGKSPASSPEFPIGPNPVGVSVVEVLGFRGASIDVKGLDMLDGTPILDIKPT